MKTDFLKQRAEEFLENANELLKKGKYSLAAFNFEQACQLYLKYYLFLKLKDYPKTHSLIQFLDGIGRVYEKNKEIEKLKGNYASTLGDLQQAYISSRYLPVEFYSSQVEKMKEFVEELKKFLEDL